MKNVFLVVLLIGANSSAFAATCKEKVTQIAKPKTLQKDLKTYHWFDCRNNPAYQKGSMNNLLKNQFMHQTQNSDGPAGLGMYVATDPSISCMYGEGSRLPKHAGACLIEVTIKKGSLISERDPYSRTWGTQAQIDSLKKGGCLKERFFTELKEYIERHKGDFCHTDDECLKSFLTLDQFPSFLADIEGESAVDFILNLEKPAIAHSYHFDTRPIGVSQPKDTRALAVRGHAYPSNIDLKVWEYHELLAAKDPQVQNFLTHMKASGSSCLDILKLNPSKETPKGYEDWLNSWKSDRIFWLIW